MECEQWNRLASHRIPHNLIRWQFTLTLLLRDGMWCRKLNEIQYTIDELKKYHFRSELTAKVSRYFCISSQHQKNYVRFASISNDICQATEYVYGFRLHAADVAHRFHMDILHFMLVLFTVYTFFLLQWPVRRIRLEMLPLCACIVATQSQVQSGKMFTLFHECVRRGAHTTQSGERLAAEIEGESKRKWGNEIRFQENQLNCRETNRQRGIYSARALFDVYANE